MRHIATIALLLSGCAKQLTEVTYTELSSQAEQREMTYATYTPPGWDGETELPLVVFLHGGGDDYQVLDKHPVVVRTFDRLITSGELPPFVLVAPDGKNSFWRNWADGSHRYEDWVVEEVIADARAKFPIIEGRDGLHLMGISMGGAGSLHIGVRHLEMFSSIAAFSAPQFTVDDVERFLDNGMLGRVFPIDEIFGRPSREQLEATNNFNVLSHPDALQGTELLIGAGTVDLPGIFKSNKRFHRHLTESGVPHRYVAYKGGHRWPDWSKVFPAALCHHLLGEACELQPTAFYALTEVEAGAQTTARID